MDNYIGITRPLKVVDGASANLDAKYGPYDSINHAISEIPISIRRIGLTVGIIFIENSVETVEEYWWKRGVEDSDLELKNTGSSVPPYYDVSYERLDAWNDYDSSKSGWVLSALLGFDLNTRVSNLEENAAASFSLSYLGNGNGIANITKTGATLTVTKANFAELDESGKILLSQLPSYEDDVLEYDSLSNFPSTGKNGTLYINKSDNRLYRWNNTSYIAISSDVIGGDISDHTHDFSSLTGIPTTISGYGILDAYTKAEIDTMLSGLTTDDFYTKTEVDTKLNLKLDKSVFDDLFEKVEISTGVYAIKAKYDLYSVGEVSAYGFGNVTDGEGGDITALAALTDVSLATPVNGDVLIYNGTHWVNHPQSDIIPEQSDIIPDLTGYATEDYVDNLISNHTHTFSSITSRPTTLGGYGITDAATASHTHTFASLTSKPSTLAGYGITDAAPTNHTHSYLPLSGGTLSGNVLPSSSLTYSLGSSSQKWKEIHVDSLLGLSSLNIGNAVLKYNSTSNALYVEKQDGTAANFYATGEVSAYQFGSGDGASSYERLDTWSQYAVGVTEGWVLSAALGKNLLDRVVDLESTTVTGDKSYVHNQNTASNTWIVEHNLNKYPSVTAVDTANEAIVCNIRYVNLNTVELTFTESFSGKAFCN